MRLPDVTLPLVMLLLCGATAGWAADFIYSPRPAEADAASDGIRVREITVKKGDTLSHLSKRHSGKGYYYPQILLFNEIKNPHRIKPGQVVRVPVSRKAAAPKKSDRIASASAPKELPQPLPVQTAVETQQKPAEKPAPVVSTVSKTEKSSYQRAVAALKKGDCDNAIKLFDEFINNHPSSPLLPEATLNRAECYLRLSAKQ